MNGSYTLSAALYGYGAQTKTVEIAFKGAEETIELQKLPTHTVTFAPQTESGDTVTGAELSLYQNGALLLRTQELTHTLPEGEYTYALRAAGFATARGSFTADGDKTVEVTLSVKQSGSAAADTDWYYDDPVADTYTLRTAEDLRGLAELVNEESLSFAGKTISLAADVDLSGAAWTPIGSWGGARFGGTFDGGGHTVTIENGEMGGTEGCFGLFGYLEGASVSDLTLRGSVRVTVSNSSAAATIIYIGALAGYASDGSSIARISNQMTMRIDATVGSGGVVDVGGIVGWCGGVTLDSCANIGAITASCTSRGVGDNNIAIVNAGGIAGLANAGTALRVTNCYNTGSVTAEGGTTKAAGILAGFSSYASGNAMYNCYSAGALSAQTVEAIRGKSTSAMTMKNNFYLTGTASTYGSAKTDAEMRAADFAGELGEAYRAETGRYPILSWERSVANVEMESFPTKTDYNDLENFDDTGLTLRVFYGESSEIVSSGWLVLDGEALRVDREGAAKVSDGVYTVPVRVSFHGAEVEVPVTVRQQTHLITSEELALAIPQPVPGEQAQTIEVETEKFSGTVTWLYEGKAFTGEFKYGNSTARSSC